MIVESYTRPQTAGYTSTHIDVLPVLPCCCPHLLPRTTTRAEPTTTRVETTTAVVAHQTMETTMVTPMTIATTMVEAPPTTRDGMAGQAGASPSKGHLATGLHGGAPIGRLLPALSFLLFLPLVMLGGNMSAASRLYQFRRHCSHQCFLMDPAHLSARMLHHTLHTACCAKASVLCKQPCAHVLAACFCACLQGVDGPRMVELHTQLVRVLARHWIA
jgi:hypothetical protein